MTVLHASATIRNKRGLHARASAKIVEAAARFNQNPDAALRSTVDKLARLDAVRDVVSVMRVEGEVT